MTTMTLDQKMLQNCQEELRMAREEIHRLTKLAMCGCGDKFTEHDLGTCGNCVAGDNSHLRSRIESLNHQHANDECANKMLLAEIERLKNNKHG